MNFGIELQSKESIFLYQDKIDPNLLYHPEELDFITITKKNPRIEVYGDAIANADFRHELEHFVNHHKGDEFVMNLENGEKKKIKIDKNILNDTEFTMTNKNIYEIPKEDFLIFIFENVIQSFREINNLLKKSDNSRVDSFSLKKLDQRRSKKVNETPFVIDSHSRWFDLKFQSFDRSVFHIISRNQERPMEFYVQITMGVRINDILSFLHVMIDEFKKIKNANAKEKIYCDIIPEIELDLSQRIGDSVMRNIKLCTIYVLFIYIRKTRDNRKKYPFFIRHNTSSLLKLLTEHEFSILLSWIHSETDKNFAMQSRIRESRQDIWKKYFGSQRSNKFNELKEFQQNKYSSCYSILNQSKMIVLIECRYFNQILNYHINPSRNLFQYISLQDLKKIKYQKKDFPILFYHLDEVPEISKLFL